jgi:hypothetical protein
MILGTQVLDIAFIVTLSFGLQMGPNKRKSWDKLNMLSAIRAVRNKEMGLAQA